MEFKRAAGQQSPSQTWIDNKLPRCPLCKSPSLWETAAETDELALVRWHFRCPNCKAVLSTPPDTTVSAVVPPVTIVKKAVAKNLRFESVGKNKLENLVGREYALADIQQWAKEKKG